MLFRYLIVWLFICLSADRVCTQTIPYRLYTVHDGLPQSQILSIFQDSRGYIWTGTYGGIAAFDGSVFRALRANDGLPYSVVTKIEEDAAGNILFKASKWLCRYDGRQVYCDTFPFELHGEFELDENKRMWIIHKEDRRIYYSNDYKNWRPAAEIWPAVPDKPWRAINFDDKRKRVLLLENCLWALQDGQFTKFESDMPSEDFRAYMAFDEFLLSDDTLMLVGERKLQLLHTDTVRRIGHAVLLPDNTLFYSNLFDRTNNLHRINADGSQSSFSINDPIYRIFADREKHIWLATEEGLVRVFTQGFLNFDRQQLQGVWSMVEDRQGNMWFGEYFSQRLKRFDGNKFTEFTIPYAIHPTLRKGQLGDFYFGGATDQEGNLYFPSVLGIKKYGGKRFSVFSKPSRRAEAQPISMHFYLDTLRQHIVSGTLGGLNVIDLKTGASVYFSTKEALGKPYNVLSVAKDINGLYWLGLGQGVAVFDVDQGRFVAEYSARRNNFPSYMVSSVACDAMGNIWAGSAGGLMWYSQAKGAFIPVASQAIRTHVSSVATWKDKYLIVGATDGIYCLDLDQFYRSGQESVRQFNQHNGYTGIEPNQNCLYIDSKDHIWVSASDIVTRITPEELEMQPRPLSVFFTEINNERILYADYNRPFHLPLGCNTVKIRFEAVGFERPSKAEFSYKIDDAAWSAWYQEDFLVLDNLSSGTYTLLVRTRSTGADPVGAVGEAKIVLIIRAPLTKELWFPYAVAFGGSLLLGLGLYYVRALRRKAKREAERHAAYIASQEQLNAERNRLIKYLQIHTLQAQLNPHFIFNILQAIQTKIYEGSRDVAGSLIVDLGHLIRRFLESSLNMGFSENRNSEITIQEEIGLLRSYIEFEQLQFSNRFDYTIHIMPELDIENICVPPMLVQPYVENAIKHGILYEQTKRCRLDVHFGKTPDNQLEIIIKDSGVGREKAQELQSNSIRMYKSRGTQILEDRIRIMQELGQGIQVSTADNPDGGTIVTLIIDL